MVDGIPGEHHMLHKLQNRIRGKPSLAAHRRLLMIDNNNNDGHMGEVPAQDIQNDTMYLADVSIGTLAQVLKLDFDTGSADC